MTLSKTLKIMKISRQLLIKYLSKVGKLIITTLPMKMAGVLVLLKQKPGIKEGWM